MKRHLVTFALLSTTVLMLGHQAEARKKAGGKGLFGGASLSVGAGFAITSADQTGINSLINAARSQASSSASTMGSGTEFMGHATLRLSNNWVAIQLRPTIFSQSQSGSGSDGEHNYGLSGYTIFPLVRLIPLSNDIIDFYLQGGIGYGKISGNIKNGGREADFEGSNFGMQIGLGAEFCFVPEHCFGVEGNYRYLPIVRNIVSRGTGPTSLPYGTSQAQNDKELEDGNGNDVATTLSGISGMLTYVYNF